MPPHPAHALSKHEAKFQLLWSKVLQGPELENEHRFDHRRRWRFDFAQVDAKIAFELEGGIFARGGGGHNRGMAFVEDCEKYNTAAMQGWAVIRLTEKQLTLDYVAGLVAWTRRSIGAMLMEGRR